MSVLNHAKPITWSEFGNLKTCGKEDNIQVKLKVVDGWPYVCVGKYTYGTYERARRAIIDLQAQLAPNPEPRI